VTNQHPITPPPELVQQWQKRFEQGANIYQLFTSIFQAGADQELEAIQEEIITQAWFAVPVHRLAQLRAARRPKPPSLKEQGLTALKLLKQRTTDPNIIEPLSQAVEQLDD
jgi:hypothetical protein